MNKTIIFIYPNITLGGAQTLAYRILLKCQTLGYKTIYISQNIGDGQFKKTIENAGIEVFITDIFDKQKISKFVKNIDSSEKKIFFFNIDIFLKHYYFNDFPDIQTIYYNVHPLNLLIFRKKIERIFSTSYIAIIKKLYLKNQLVFMDEANITETNIGLKTSFSDKEKLVRLPVFFPEINVETISEKFDGEKINFLTISRFDFPFKGYVIGLIKSMEVLMQYNESINLTIIGEGSGEYQVIELINNLPSGIQKRIKYIGSVTYDDLEQHFKQAHYYIGMGTTILDASKFSVPSLVVDTYTYECVLANQGFFCDNPTYIGDVKKQESSNNFIDMIKYIIENHNYQFYMDLSKRSYSVAKENYDIDCIVPELINHQIDKNIDISSSDINVLSKYFSIRRKIIQWKNKKIST